jgi:hypothetical protein
VVQGLIDGLDRDPSLLLDRLEERMRELAAGRRYEEAGWARDRHGALARAIERRHRCQSLAGLGLVEAEGSDGSRALIDHGRLVATWRLDRSPPLRPAPDVAGPRHEVPDSVEVAEEADLVWRWLANGEVRLVEATGTFSLPTRRARQLLAST